MSHAALQARESLFRALVRDEPLDATQLATLAQLTGRTVAAVYLDLLVEAFGVA